MGFSEWRADSCLSWNNGAEGKVTHKARSSSLPACAASAAFLPPPLAAQIVSGRRLSSVSWLRRAVCHLTTANIAQGRVA